MCRCTEAEKWCRGVEVCRLLFRGDDAEGVIEVMMQRCTVAQVQKCRFGEVVQRMQRCAGAGCRVQEAG